MKKKLNCILFIDDDEPTNFLNKMTAEQAECAAYVRVVESGQEALDYLMREGKFKNAGDEYPRPELIFLDINMPAMDGWEFLDKYRMLSREQQASVVMIMLTTSLNPDDELRTKDIPEIAGFENKPLQKNRLDAILRTYFPEQS
jgi:CheY-like chemotaxis protein